MMKKKLIAIVAALLSLGMLFTACGADDDPAADGEKKALPTQEVAPAEEEVHYRDIMVPYDQVTKSDRIILLQTALCFNGREGIYTEAEVAPAEDFSFNGAAVKAFRMENATKFLNNKLAGDVQVYDMNGTATTMSAADFNALRVLSVDASEAYLENFQGSVRVDLVSENGATVIKDFKYAVTAEGEGVLSVAPKAEIAIADLLQWMGWDESADYNLVATDKFYVPDTVIDGLRGSIVSPLSGTTINGKIQDTSVAQGRINDLIYVEKIVK